jgi:hypothetical protein
MESGTGIKREPYRRVSVEEQAQFTTLYIEKTMSLKHELLVWSFLFDPDAPQPFTTMGFL